MGSNYNELASITRELQGRQDLTHETISGAVKDLDKVRDAVKTEGAICDNLSLAKSIFHFLRNSCVQCKRNQDWLIECNVVLTLKDIVEIVIEPGFEPQVDDSKLLNSLKSMMLQFLGNLVAQNKSAQRAVWKVAFPKLFFSLLSHLDDKGKEILCMVIYNCMVNQRDPFESDDCLWLVVSILQHCKSYESSEWGLLILEIVLSSSEFPKIYQEVSCYPDIRYLLLEAVHTHIEDLNSEVRIPESNLLFLAESFISKSNCILRLATEVSEELQQEAVSLLQVLSLLCSATAHHEKFKDLCKKMTLLEMAVSLLVQISDDRVSSHFSKPSVPEVSADENDPVLGFKRDLIRLIGNMSYRIKENQDAVRKLNGLVPILNSCNVDEKNPYIMQWAIFAIRNLCEGNQENQQLIKDLKQQGLADNDFLTSSNIDVVMENGKVRVKNKSP